MLAPAAFWGGAVPSAAQTAGMEPSRAYDAATPGAIESAGLGFMMNSHRKGLQSGGMVGYSTFFTGYDPSRGHGTGRMLSLGRLAAGGVSVASQGLLQTPLGNYDAAAKVLEPLTMTHKYGLGGAMHAIAQGPISSGGGGSSSLMLPGRGGPTLVGGSGGGSSVKFAFAGHPLDPNARSSAINHQPGRPAGMSGAPTGTRGVNVSDAEVVGYRDTGLGTRYSGVSVTQSGPSTLNPTGGRGVRPGNPLRTTPGPAGLRGGPAGLDEKAIRNAKVVGVSGAADDAASRASWGKWITGLLGGEGYKKGGTQAAFREATETIGERTWGFAAAADDTAGMAFGGVAGRALGAAFKLGVGYEAARIAVDATTYVAGEAYESMVETTTTLRRRLGSDQSMSPAYYNRAAATERQRARRELNSRSLNPRTQLRGNEAYMAHG